jgi:hypothetical protein
MSSFSQSYHRPSALSGEMFEATGRIAASLPPSHRARVAVLPAAAAANILKHGALAQHLCLRDVFVIRNYFLECSLFVLYAADVLFGADGKEVL